LINYLDTTVPRQAFLSLSLSLSLTHTHTHTHSLSLALALALSRSRSRSRSLSRSLVRATQHYVKQSQGLPKWCPKELKRERKKRKGSIIVEPLQDDTCNNTHPPPPCAFCQRCPLIIHNLSASIGSSSTAIAHASFCTLSSSSYMPKDWKVERTDKRYRKCRLLNL
jgi:hypothetical protein